MAQHDDEASRCRLRPSFLASMAVLLLLLVLMVSQRRSLPAGIWLVCPSVSQLGGSTQRQQAAAALSDGANHHGHVLSAPEGAYTYSTLQVKAAVHHKTLGQRMMLGAGKVSTSKQQEVVEEQRQAAAGSRPPTCHNECPHCQGGACVARPTFSRSGSALAQHAVWTCACLHA
ncbi:hypothetical protein L7F22_057974 [Adiantum nelumboides]|nr:hypothetical protein [Adiantum nelumboides]